MNFSEHYNEEYSEEEIQSFLQSLKEGEIPDLYEFDCDEESNLLTEIGKWDLTTKTDMGRIRRAMRELRTRPPKLTELVNGEEMLEYNFKANPSTEFRRHWGYVIYKGNKINELFCDCKDFFFRLYAPLVKKGLAVWEPDLPKKFQRRYARLNNEPYPSGYAGKLPHNRQWTKITNPSGKIFVCKHLYALITRYMED